jgi:hypothetical protein
MPHAAKANIPGTIATSWSPPAAAFVDGLQGPLLEVDIAEIIVHEADEPNAVVDFPDAEFLTGEHGRDIDLFPVH